MYPTRTINIVLSGLFVALAVGAGYALAQFPNIELVTAVIFLAGCVLGAARGATVGLIAEFLYSMFNPYGVAALPVLAAQVLGMVVAGAAGGIIVKGLRPDMARSRLHLIFGAAGVALTLLFDLLTTLGTLWLIGPSIPAFLGLLAVGSMFYLAHMLGNAIAFSVLLPLAWRELSPLHIFQTQAPPQTTLKTKTLCEEHF